jgi:hypothetical protein
MGEAGDSDSTTLDLRHQTEYFISVGVSLEV